ACSSVIAPQALAQEGAETIEEVMVTARRREESLQEVPVSVAVVDAAAIEARSLQSIDDIARFTPGLSFSKAFGRATERPVIRGLGNVLAGVQFGVESGAAYFVDGVYYPGDLQGLNLNDLERVEVIKGPQSALYGRNSYAGAINFVTKSPTEELSGDVRLLFAEDGEQDLRASVSGPLIPGVLGGSLSLRSYEFDGQWDNQVTGQTIGDESTDSISGLLEWTPNERLRVRVRGQYQEDEDGTRPLFLQPGTENNCSPGLRSLSSLPLWGVDNNFQYFCGDIEARPIALNDQDAVGENILRGDVPAVGGTFFGDPYSRTDGTPFDGVQREINLASFLMDYEFDSGYALTLSSAYRKEELKTGSDSDHSSVNFKFSAGTPGEPFENGFFAISGGSEREDYSMELRFDSPQDRDFRWMVGAFYFDQEIDGFNINFGAPNRYETTTTPSDEQALTNQAVFGSVTYDFSERLTASAEIRYMEEDKTLTDAAFNGDDTWSSTTPRFTLNYQVSDAVMLYASYAEGAKPGGFNGSDGDSVSRPIYDQEESVNYELGVKSTMMNGRLIAMQRSSLPK
ncbi:TonB-dependent receptor, plug, partial [gamma proteobacterium NOR5-3]